MGVGKLAIFDDQPQASGRLLKTIGSGAAQLNRKEDILLPTGAFGKRGNHFNGTGEGGSINRPAQLFADQSIFNAKLHGAVFHRRLNHPGRSLDTDRQHRGVAFQGKVNGLDNGRGRARGNCSSADRSRSCGGSSRGCAPADNHLRTLTIDPVLGQACPGSIKHESGLSFVGPNPHLVEPIGNIEGLLFETGLGAVEVNHQPGRSRQLKGEDFVQGSIELKHRLAWLKIEGFNDPLGRCRCFCRTGGLCSLGSQGLAFSHGCNSRRDRLGYRHFRRRRGGG